jgi:hypothetical protein
MSEDITKVTLPEGTTEEEALEFARLVSEATAKMFAALMDISEDDDIYDEFVSDTASVFSARVEHGEE